MEVRSDRHICNLMFIFITHVIIFNLLFVFTASIYAFSDDFNDGKAEGWAVSAGKWEITNGEYHAPSEVNTSPYPLTFALDGKEFGEFTIEAEVRNDKFHSTMNQSHAGFAFGMDAKNTGYVLYFRFHRGLACPEASSLVLRYTIENGKGWEPNADVAEGCKVFEAGDQGNWHVLKAEVSTNKGTLKTWVDGKPSIDIKLKVNPGKIGLWTADIGAASFDDVSINGPGILAVQPSGSIPVKWGDIKKEYLKRGM